MEKNELIEQNLRLVHACAHRFTGKGVVEADGLHIYFYELGAAD